MYYGLNSLITAQVVEATVDAAQHEEFKNSLSPKQKRKLAVAISRISDKFVSAQHRFDRSSGLHNRHEMLLLSRPVFAAVVESDVEVQACFAQLGIDEADCMDLFDALDADRNGSLELQELVKGLLLMRGMVKKTDIVGTRLGVTALSGKIARLEHEISDNQRRIFECLADVLRQITVCHAPSQTLSRI